VPEMVRLVSIKVVGTCSPQAGPVRTLVSLRVEPRGNSRGSTRSAKSAALSSDRQLWAPPSPHFAFPTSYCCVPGTGQVSSEKQAKESEHAKLSFFDSSLLVRCWWEAISVITNATIRFSRGMAEESNPNLTFGRQRVKRIPPDEAFTESVALAH